MKQGFVYMVSNKNRTTIYVGVTNNLERRILEHKRGIGSAFTSKYNLTDLMYFEQIDGMLNAINREKQLKNWHKEWKWNLIRKDNPELKDLSEGWYKYE
jgi:putative endonuclease